MRHNFYIFVGDKLKALSEDVLWFLHLNGEEVREYFHLAAIATDGELLAEKLSVQPVMQGGDKFYADNKNLWRLVHDTSVSLQGERQMADFFADWKNQEVTIKNMGDDGKATFTFILPVWDEKCIEIVNHLLKIVKQSNDSISLDVIALSTDLYEALGLEKGDVPDQLKVPAIAPCHRYIFLSNKNEKGVALDLDGKMLSRILSDYVITCIENYAALYPHAEETEYVEAESIGMTEVFFDKYYYADYLIHQAYIKLLEREKISQSEVDVNKVDGIVQANLTDSNKLVTRFLEEHVSPLINEGVGDEQIVTRTTPQLKEDIKKLTVRLQDFLKSDEYSFPEKQAIMAMLLGNDNKLLTNYLFREEQLILDDCNTQPVEMYLYENNIVPGRQRNENGAIIKESERVLNDKDSDEELKNMLPEIKKVRNEIMSDTAYLRKKERELEEMKGEFVSDDEPSFIYTENGFEHNGKLFRFGEKPYYEALSENYAADGEKMQSVDLRNYFTSIKNQGEVGACVAFAVTSIYEYILNKNHADVKDLSERFVYYNVIKETGLDLGSTFNMVIDSMANVGICEEKYCIYDENLYKERPSEDAYANAAKHKIAKALNVSVRHEDINSALRSGYPVGISLQLFESFGRAINGFIPYPDPNETMRQTHSYHAMVICGCDCENKLYIVRNSWGTEFGDNGYCYIPFDYVQNFCDGAFIVSEINESDVENIQVQGIVDKVVAKFDDANANIRFAILLNKVSEKARMLCEKSDRYVHLRNKYESLIEEMADNSKRKRIIDKSKTQREMLISQLKRDYENFRNERVYELNACKSEHTWNRVRIVLTTLALIVFYCLFRYLFKDYTDSMMANVLSLTLAGVVYYFVDLGMSFVRSVKLTSEMPDKARDGAEKLEQFKDGLIIVGLTAFAILIYCLLQAFLPEVANSTLFNVLLFLGIGIITFLCYNFYASRKIKKIEEEHEERLEQKLRDIKVEEDACRRLNVNMTIAGEFLDEFHGMRNQLSSKYKALQSMLDSFNTWYEEEKERSVNKKVQLSQAGLFQSVIDNGVLDAFLEKRKDAILADIHLYDYVDDFVKSPKMEKIQTKIFAKLNERIMKELDDFSIYKYLTGTHYEFLPACETTLNKLLPTMDANSSVFVRWYAEGKSLDAEKTPYTAEASFISIRTDTDAEKNEWEKTYPQFFSLRPVAINASSKYRLVVLKRRYNLMENVRLF